MKTILLKNRYGDSHRLIPINEKKYRFESAKGWMTISLHGEEDNYKAMDPDGGPFIGIGDEIEGKIISKIYESGAGIIIEFE